MRRRIIRFLSSVLPGPFVSIAYRRLVHPKKHVYREGELELLSEAQQDECRIRGIKIKVYRWGHGSRSVLLVHGWEGSAANFAGLIPTLVQNDCTVYAFDGPSHGMSSDSDNPLFDFPFVLMELLGKFRPDVVIGHSFGSVTTTYALAEISEYHPAGCILITTPDRFVDRVQELSESLGMSSAVTRGLLRKVERNLNVDPSALNVSDFVRTISDTSALLIHDVNDRVIPSKHSVAVSKNWKGAQLHLIEGTGHFRILKSDAVAQIIVQFMNHL
jgi:pimeloyl-ACP methyl ester carboxylesterase